MCNTLFERKIGFSLDTRESLRMADCRVRGIAIVGASLHRAKNKISKSIPTKEKLNYRDILLSFLFSCKFFVCILLNGIMKIFILKRILVIVYYIWLII